MPNITRKTGIVIGASRGIGLGIARRLDEEGYRLTLTGQTIESQRRLEGKLASLTSADHLSTVCDVSDEHQIEALFTQATATLGQIDVVVVNAGIDQQQPAIDITAADWDRLFAVNVRGAMLCCRAAARCMADCGGAIVVIGSIAGERPAAGRACYCAAKAAIHAYAQCVALEWAPRGIRVNVVAPGPIDTDFINAAAESLNGRENLARLIPLGRIGSTEDVAAAVGYLVSDAASYVTGAVLRVDGGRLWS